MLDLVKKFVGSANERTLKKFNPLVAKINDLEAKTERYSEAQLQGKTVEFREKLANGASLEDLLPSAFAACLASGLSAALRGALTGVPFQAGCGHRGGCARRRCYGFVASVRSAARKLTCFCRQVSPELVDLVLVYS